MSATILIYNGVQIERARILSGRAENIYDDSGVVLVGIRKSIEFSGWVTRSSAEEAIQQQLQIERALAEPRKQLQVSSGGGDFALVRGAGSDDPIADVERGPKPSNINVTNVHGGRAFQVAGRIEWMEPVEQALTVDPLILSHRWEQRFNVDDVNYQTRTVTGIMKFSGRSSTLNPDLFRCYVLPHELEGARRESLEFAVSADGLSLMYQCTDRERFLPYPDAVLKASGTMSIAIKGAVAEKSLSFRLEADKHTPKSSIIAAAKEIIQSRFTLVGGENKDTIRGIQLTEDLWGSNSLDVQVASTTTAVTGTDPVRVNPAGINLFSDLSALYGNRGSEGRFTQIGPYGASLAHAAMQAMFDHRTDGNPATACDVERADTGRLDRLTLTDSDDDGYIDADSICACPPPTAWEVPQDLEPDAEILISAGSPTISSEHGGNKPYLRVEQTTQTVTHTNEMIVPTADPAAPDIVHQVAAPRVFVMHAGYLERLNAPPVMPTPPELTASTRRFIVRERTPEVLTTKPAGDGSGIVYCLAYGFTLERVYDPSDSDAWGSASVAIGDGANSTFTEAKLPSGLPAPANPQLLAGSASLIPFDAETTWV